MRKSEQLTMMSEESCPHINAITSIRRPQRLECAECVKIGASWVTCDVSGMWRDPFAIARLTNTRSKHAHVIGHPVIASAQPGERWLIVTPWDEAFAEY